jgi:hypothetical protein
VKSRELLNSFFTQVTLIVSVIISIIPVSFKQIGNRIVVRPPHRDFTM